MEEFTRMGNDHMGTMKAVKHNIDLDSTEAKKFH